MLHLSRPAARALLLAAQGLLHPPTRQAERADVLAAIRRMGVLQIDTIHVVARSPYFVLWSRLGDYEPRWLDELLAEGALFEYWSHAACFIPAEDYPLYRRLMVDDASRYSRHARAWLEQHREGVATFLQRVREAGQVRSADFARTDGRRGQWWDWKWEKVALEMLLITGDLMVARRHNFQRIYDLRERVRPDPSDTALPSQEAVRRALALKAVRALGVAPARWVPDYFRTPKTGAAELLAALAAEGALIEARVEDVKGPAYLHPDHLSLAEAAAAGRLTPTYTTLLSPFDPVVWDRARAQALFGFDYQIECYTPAPRRRYGYFSLPILRRGALVGRLDAKAHRKDARFEVRALHLEPGVAPTDDLLADLAGAIGACAAWHGTPQVVVQQSDPPEVAPALGELVRALPT